MKRLSKRWLYSCFVLTVGFTVANAEMVRIENKKGVLLDTETALLWQDNEDVKTVEKNWQEAIDYCENLTLGGYNDWKLPDKDILEALCSNKSGLQNVIASYDYWSNLSHISGLPFAWYVSFYYDKGSWGQKINRNLVRCVRDGEYFDSLSFSSFLDHLKASKSIVLFSKSRGNLVQKEGKSYFGTTNELKKEFGLEKKTVYSKTPFEDIQKLTQEQINNYLIPRKPFDIASQIPKEIPKPTLPKSPELVKDEFEKKADFEKRVQSVMDDRENEIAKLQEKYRQDVENRNNEIENLKKRYDDELVQIKKEQENKKANLPQKIEEFSKEFFMLVMQNIAIKDASYDVENETMHITLKATNAEYEKKASFKMAPLEAKSFKQNLVLQMPQMVFDYENNSFILKKIEIQNPNEIIETTKEVEKLFPQEIEKTRVVKGFFGGEKEEKYTEIVQVKKTIKETTKAPKTYLASLITSDFKPEIVKVAITDKKVEFDSAAQTKLALQNPNLTDKYQVQALGYGESNSAKGLKYNDDLTPLIKKMAVTKPNPKNWLFAVAIEKYDEADAVIYAANSAKTMISAMQKRLGISERNTYALIDEKATGGAIKGQLERLLENVKEGDNIYFYYSGHGIPSGENGEAFILPKDVIADYVTRESEFMARNIYKKLSDSKASKIVAFVDSCYSGKTDGISNIKGVAAGVFKTKKVEFDSSKMVVLTAGTNGQFSNAYSEKGQRLFSYFVAKGLATRPDLDINSLYQEVSVGVKDESFKMGDNKRQVPQIEGNTGMGL